MGQPTPPGDMPLFEGLGTEWNDIVGAFPEDKRAELAPKLKERIDAFTPLKAYEDFHKSGISPEHIGTALNLFSVIENNPREVYETIGKHLGLTPKETKEVIQQVQQSQGSNDNIDSEDPRIKTLQQQVDTLAQIALAQRQQEASMQAAAEQDAALEKELNDLKKKFGDVDEEEIIMRMLHKGMTAEQAYEEYSGKVSSLRRRPPAPMLLNGGGSVPSRAIDPAKLNSSETKNLVTQMLQAAADQAKL